MAITLEMLQGEAGFSALSGCGEFDPTCGPLRLASMRYDYRDQMVEYEETFGSGAFIRFQYDALGRRVSRLSLDSATYYVQGGQGASGGWQVLAEYDGPAATASLKADYVYGNYIDEPIQMRRDYDGSGPGALQTFYYHQDDLFNVVALTAGPGGVSVPSLGTFPSGAVVERYRYGDYGLPAFFNDAGTSAFESARTGNPYLFTGREWDGQSRLYHYRTRYMEPTWGRFTTRDTIGIWGDSANRGAGYEYVGGRPQVSADPYGLLSVSDLPFIGTAKRAWDKFHGITPGTNWSDYSRCRPKSFDCRKIGCSAAEQSCGDCINRQAFRESVSTAKGGVYDAAEGVIGGYIEVVTEKIRRDGLKNALRVGGGILIIDGLLDAGMMIDDIDNIIDAAEAAKSKLCKCPKKDCNGC